MTGKQKVMVVFGTRPEAIKMAPLVRALARSRRLQPVVCATAQHRGMLDQALDFFELRADIDLNLMRPNQDLASLTAACLSAMSEVYEQVQPRLVLVQGDTTTTFAAALAAFYRRIPIGHVEAGLRTWRKEAPFPEESNRRMVSPLSDLHFAPTAAARANLLRENYSAGSVFVTGNTSIDALLWASARELRYPHLESRYRGKRLCLLTVHRRENFGEPIRQILRAVRQFAATHPDCHFVFPVHLNPQVREPARELLGQIENVSLLDPLSYGELALLLRDCTLVLTDSGGIQEEAPTLGKPVLVLRESTERPEAVTAGCARLVGHDPARIMAGLDELLAPESPALRRMARVLNPFGDGTAAQQIAAIVENYLSGKEETIADREIHARSISLRKPASPPERPVPALTAEDSPASP